MITNNNNISPEQKITELEKQVQELLAKIYDLQKNIIDWHSAMFAALCLVLKPHRSNLTMEREHLLNLMPTRIDCLIVKKDRNIPIDMDVFRLFRKYNIIELKSYEDTLNIDVIWHTIGYAAQYKSLEEHLNEIPEDEITITVFRNSFPRELFNMLRSLGWKIEEKYHNIFYITGKVCFPIQIVIAKDLGKEYLPVQILTGRAKEQDIREFAVFRESLTDIGDKIYANAVIQACAEANRELFLRIWEDEKMQNVLRELMEDEFVKERNEGINIGRQEGIGIGRQVGRQEGIDIGRKEVLIENIKSLMKTLKLSSEEAMNALNIPQSERAVYMPKL